MATERSSGPGPATRLHINLEVATQIRRYVVWSISRVLMWQSVAWFFGQTALVLVLMYGDLVRVGDPKDTAYRVLELASDWLRILLAVPVIAAVICFMVARGSRPAVEFAPRRRPPKPRGQLKATLKNPTEGILPIAPDEP